VLNVATVRPEMTSQNHYLRTQNPKQLAKLGETLALRGEKLQKLVGALTLMNVNQR